jgi:DNA polymerase III delta subunit
MEAAMILDEVLRHRVTLFVGSEDVLRRRALAEVLSSTQDGDGFDTESFVAGDSSFQDWIGSAMTLPFLASRRIVVVRNLLRAGDPDSGVEAALSALPESALLLLVADEEVGDWERQQRFERAARLWAAAVKKAKGGVASFEVPADRAASQLCEAAKALGKNLSMPAATLLINMAGGSFSRALEELDKIALYVGDEPGIREQEVQAVAVASRDWNVYRIVSSVASGDAKTALEQMRLLVESPQKAEEAAFQRIFPQLSRHLRLIFQARLCVERRCTPANLPEDLASLFPDKPNLSSEKDWQQRQAMQAARDLTLDQIAECFAALSDADAAIKGLEPSYTTIDTLERMILRMVEAARDRRGARSAAR